MKLQIGIAFLTLFAASHAFAKSFEDEVRPLLEASCLHCHDAETKTGLNLESLSFDLSQPDVFRKWIKVFDRVHDGEMPPKSEDRPDEKQREAALDSLKTGLRTANVAEQKKHGRVRSRRLTRLEFEYTLRDLLHIEDDLAQILPEESDSGGFDTVGATQRVSPVHIRSYLKAADQALDTAINLKRRPWNRRRPVDYFNSPYVNMWYDIPLDQGGKVIKKLDDAVALFVDLDYIMRSDASGLQIDSPGYYRIGVEAYAYQAKTPVTLKVIQASEKRGGARLIGAYDLKPDETREVEATVYLRPGDYLYPSVADADPIAGVYAVGGAKHYKGEGVAVKKFFVEGPLIKQWPPPSTRELLTGVELPRGKSKRKGVLEALGAAIFSQGQNSNPAYNVKLSKEPIDHVAEIVGKLAPRAFRRPAKEGELDSFIELARPGIEENRDFADVVRIPLRSMLSSPQFLFFEGQPGELDDYALASRLSYFLWKSMPDEELFQLAGEGKLSDPKVLREQVDRMLEDERSVRFVKDFLGQWLSLYDINATTPDEYLYPEYDDILNQAMPQETELFFAELIKRNLAVESLIDADFTFLNRRLAEHYGHGKIDDQAAIHGQQFRKVALPKSSLRGGVLTQASILKVTANGTVTSPVTRGNFVLTKILGDPPNPPPPNVGSIEPDTRGATTIREVLDAHRNTETCAQCHRKIDPPGFALESFDPIGGYRERYRASGRKVEFQAIVRAKNYRYGPKVDASGVTADGESFAGISEFKKLLLKRKDQIARHFIEQLVVYSTGAEVQFADREAVAEIVETTRKNNYPVRTIIHQIVQSELFRNK